MRVLGAEHADTGVGFRRWHNDLHKPEAVIWSDRGRVLARLQYRRADGTMIFVVDDAGHLDGIVDARRLALVFRADHARFRRRKIVPLFTGDFAVDRDGGVIEARFATDHAARGNHALPYPIEAALVSRLLFRRSVRASVVSLSRYHGEFVLSDSAHCLSPGMAVHIKLWLPWTGELHLRAQLTACRTQLGSDRFAFRIVDRASVRNAAVVLAGTVDGFGFDALRAAGVRPGRMTRYLTVQTVSDPSTFRKALDVRLAANRTFGRLAGVFDAMSVEDDLDPHSVNFMCLLGDKALGAGRVVVNSGNRALSEIESETAGLPAWVWSGGFVEVSRLAIHPDYRGGGVTIALFREVARLAFNLDCRYLVLDAIEKLVPLYQKIGAKSIPLTKTHPYSKETVQVMVIDIGDQLGHIDRRWPYWQFMFGPVLRHHFDTSSARALNKSVSGVRRIPYWMKRALSHVA